MDWKWQGETSNTCTCRCSIILSTAWVLGSGALPRLYTLPCPEMNSLSRNRNFSLWSFLLTMAKQNIMVGKSCLPYANWETERERDVFEMLLGVWYWQPSFLHKVLFPKCATNVPLPGNQACFFWKWNAPSQEHLQQGTRSSAHGPVGGIKPWGSAPHSWMNSLTVPYMSGLWGGRA